MLPPQANESELREGREGGGGDHLLIGLLIGAAWIIGLSLHTVSKLDVRLEPDTQSHILLFILTKLFVFKMECNVKCHLKATYSFFFLLWYNIEKYVCVLYCIPVSIPGGNIT